MNEAMVPKIETDRLLLREITTADLGEWTDILFADKDVMHYSLFAMLLAPAR